MYDEAARGSRGGTGVLIMHLQRGIFLALFTINDTILKASPSFPPPKALLDLIEPYFHPLFDDLMDDVESGRTWTLAHVPEAISKLNSNMMDIAHLVPPSFYQVGNNLSTFFYL